MGLNMVRIEFEVEGSTGKIYRVKFEKAENTVHAFCDCDAGLKGSYCKHRLEIMDGQYNKIISENLSDLKILKEILSDSELERAYQNLMFAEKRHLETKKDVEKMRKLLSRAMHQ